MLQLRQLQSRLDELQAVPVVVTFELDVIAENYVRATELEWPLLIDAERRLYRAYGMQTGNWWDLAGPAAIWSYLKLFAKGRTLKRVSGDVTQLGGDVVIDPDGVIRFHHVANGPADRPPVETLLNVLQAD